MTLKRTLSLLPFTSARGNGSLNLWDVPATGQPAADHDLGRHYAAWWLHTIREYDAPGLLFHASMDRIRDAGGPLMDDLNAGACAEWHDALAAADQHHPHLVSTTHLRFNDLSLREATLRLPFVSAQEDGSLNLWDVRLPEGFSEQQDRGRYYAAVLTRFIMETQHPNVLRHVIEAMPSDFLGSDSHAAFLSVIAELATSGPADATVHQRAVCPLYREMRRSSGGRLGEIIAA